MTRSADSTLRNRIILLVEDDEAHANLIHRIFKESSPEWKIHRVSSLKDAFKWLEENESPSLIISDYLLPDGNGLDLAKGAMSPEEVGVPLIILTAYGTEQLAVRSLKSGAMDYVVKTAEEFQLLPRTVERVLREWNRIIKEKEVEEALRRSEEKYRVTFENTGTAMAVLEEDTTVSLVNSQFEKLTGYSKEEIEGKVKWPKLTYIDKMETMLEYHKKRR